MTIARAVVTIHHPSLGGVGTNTWHIHVGDAEEEWTANLGTGMGVVKEFYEGVQGVIPDSAHFDWDGRGMTVAPEIGSYIQAINTDTFVVPGAVAGGVMPPANCICVTWRAFAGGRHGIGRTFLGPISSFAGDAANGTPTSSAMTQVRDAAEELSASADGSAGSPVIFSVAQNLSRRISVTSVSDQFAVLRSRRD